MSVRNRHILMAALFGAASLVGVPASAAPALNAAQGLGLAETASGGETELASLASAKATVQSVKQLAQATINDHADTNRKVRALAEKFHVRVAASAASNALQKEADDATARLDTGGAAFDRAYMQAAIRLHQRVLIAIDAARPGLAGELQALLDDVRARVEHELDAAKDALAAL